MAKRANPYVEDFVPQAKVYVGTKQFNNNEIRLKKVYEKTLNLLLNGAKKLSGPEVTNAPSVDTVRKQEVTIAPSVDTVHKKDSKRQLLIGKDGTLLQSTCVIPESPASVVECACGERESVRDAGCTYCERALCERCERTCQRCQLPHCSHCFVNGSELSYCVSCYG